MRSRFVFFTALFAVSSLGAPLAAPAAPGGLAWDSVSRIVQSPDAASLQEPGNFDADYATAAALKPEEPHGGGMLGKLKQMASMGANMSKLMFSGFADKHYVAGSKERVDSVFYHKATITDCAARTITTLDLAKKTYKVVSMDQPSSSGGSSSGGNDSGGMGKDDGTKISIVVKNTALGPKSVAGQSTTGYTSDTTFTETKPSGESQSQNANVTGYYSNYATPTVNCSRPHVSNPMSGGGAGDMNFSAMSSFTRYADMLANAGVKSDRFSVKQSGPSIPFGKLSMYEAMSIKGDAAHGLAFVTERGNVRAIDANDPIFSVPGDFTKEN